MMELLKTVKPETLLLLLRSGEMNLDSGWKKTETTLVGPLNLKFSDGDPEHFQADETC